MKKTLLMLTAIAVTAGFAVISPELETRLATAETDRLIPVDIALTEQYDSEYLNEQLEGLFRRERQTEAARILREWSASRQSGLVEWLESRQADGVVNDIQGHWLVNMVYCEATPAVIRAVDALDGVWYVHADVRHVPDLLPKATKVDVTDEITWGVDTVRAPEVWAMGYTGQGIVVGDIDTGCNYNHQDLADHMWTDPNYPNHGWNFENNSNDPMDAHGHGTHTCGTVASDGTAGSQCGVAPDAMIMACRVRTVADSLAETQVWAAMEFVVSPPLSPANGGDLITMSLGWRNSWDPMRKLWRDGCNNTGAAGVTMIVAAGNERSSPVPYSCRTPGDVPPPWWNPENVGTGTLSNVISIGATDYTNSIASFSSKGPCEWGTVVGYADYVHPPGLTRPDVSAPGVDVKSCRHNDNSGYTNMSGTSMATPHTAGVAALMKSKNPEMLPRQVDSILELSAVDFGDPGKDMDFGAGRIDAVAALMMTQPPFGVRYLAHAIDDSVGGNDDGIINPGEAINMPVWVMNLCDYNASGVWGVIRTDDANITITDSVKHFGSIAEGDTGYTGAVGFGFAVAGSCTNGYLLEFELVISDTLDSAWVSGLGLACGTPVLAGDSVYAYDGGNGKLDPGEETDIAIELVNSGFGHGYDVSVVLVSYDARLEVLDSMADYGTVPADSFAMNEADHFRVRADASLPPEFVIPCTLMVTQTGYPDQNIYFGLEVGRLTGVDPVPDGPRTPALYWAYDDLDSYYPEHPDFNWVEISGVGTRLTLSDDQTVQVSLPGEFGPFVFYGQSYTQVSICGNGWIAPGTTTYSAYSNLELPATAAPPMLAACWDDMYPPTGGGVWYYHDADNHRFIVEWDSVAYYSPRTTFETFQIILYDTTMAAGNGNSEFTYQYLTGENYSSCTVGEQDETKTIAIQTLYNEEYHRASAVLAAGRAIKFSSDSLTTGVAELAPAGRLGRLALAPSANPFQRSVMMRYSLPQPTHARLLVYDAVGRVVRTLLDSNGEPVAAGAYSAPWNGRDDRGATLSAGIYFCRLETGIGNVASKTVLAR